MKSCKQMSSKKYVNRAEPPFNANRCKLEFKFGNDQKLYRSMKKKSEKGYKWRLIENDEQNQPPPNQPPPNQPMSFYQQPPNPPMTQSLSYIPPPYVYGQHDAVQDILYDNEMGDGKRKKKSKSRKRKNKKNLKKI